MSRLRFSIVFAALWMPLIGMAQTSPTTAGTQPVQSGTVGLVKLAWLNLEQAIITCEEGKRELGEVQKFVENKNAELEALRKESESLKNQLNVQGPKLTDEARADLEDQIDAKDTNLQRFQQDTQKEIDARRVRTTNFIGRRMIPIIEKLSKEKGLGAVFYINPSRDAWVDPALLITDEVIKAYNQAYTVEGAKAPVTSTAPAQKP